VGVGKRRSDRSKFTYQGDRKANVYKKRIFNLRRGFTDQGRAKKQEIAEKGILKRGKAKKVVVRM